MVNDVNIGDRVIVCGGFGTEAPQEVEVLDVDEKNGRPLIDYKDAKGELRWAYFHQITRVVARARVSA